MPSTRNIIIISAILHLCQIGVIIFIITKPDKSHSHNYANSYHNHSIDSHNHDYADQSHSHNFSYAEESHEHYNNYAEESHTHSAEDIDYKSYAYGGYGTLQSKLNEIDDKADDSHSHSAFEIIGVENHSHNDYHSHSAFEIIGIEDHSHYGYAESYHTHY